MALFDFLKRKKEVEKVHPIKSREAGASPKAKQFNRAGEKKPAKKPAKKVHPVKSAEGGVSARSGVPASQETLATRKPKQFNRASDFSYSVIKEPHISEKGSYLAEKNQYIFQVLPNYNKNEIKKAVEGIYGVDVLSVNVIKIPAKKRRIGRTEGFRKGYRKAIIKIKEGQKIEIL